jgi:hypothetical protein
MSEINSKFHKVTLCETQEILNFIYKNKILDYELHFMGWDRRLSFYEYLMLDQSNGFQGKMTFFFIDKTYIKSGHWKKEIVIKDPNEPIKDGGIVNYMKEKYYLFDMVKVKCDAWIFPCNIKPARPSV